jgi:hypothetical protein
MEFIPEGATLNKRHCKEILHRPCSSLHCKHPEVWCRKKWLAVATWQRSSTSLYACASNKHISLHAHLLSHHVRESISVSRGDRRWHKGSCMGSYFSVSSSYTNVGRLAMRPTSTVLREHVDMCKCMQESCNVVLQNHSPRNYWGI